MGKRQEIREKRQKQQSTQKLLLIVGVTLVFFALALIFILPNLPKNVGEFVTPEQNPRPLADMNAMGDINAPVTITEYSDYLCSYCLRFFTDTEPAIVEAYVATGKVRFIYRSFGYFLAQDSGNAAQATYCAGDQGKFWEMHDIIFANWSGESAGVLAENRLKAFAGAIALDMDTFNACYDSQKYRSVVDQDGLDGKDLGVRATPTFIISYVVNGETITKVVEGALPFSDFQQEIEAALAAADAK